MADADSDTAHRATEVATGATAAPASTTDLGDGDDRASISAVGAKAGARSGRYVLVRRLGAGGMGEVWEADDPELGRRVAVKLLRHEIAAGKARMQREARAMARLAHPNVITVHDVGEAGGQVFVAMELIDGGTLRAWTASKPRRRWREIVETFVAAGRGLVAAHGAGLVHRDFKPDNVLLRSDGRVVVSDFGLARLGAGGDAAGDASSDSGSGSGSAPPSGEAATIPGGGGDARDAVASPLATITDADRLVGTPAYMAPEQHLGRGATAASDQFAYCVTLWEALYGERPFAAAQGAGITPAMGIGIAIVDGAVRPPPADVRVPGWLRRAVERGLAVEPARRFPSMQALVATLERGLARRRRIAIAAGAAAIATAAVLGAVVLRPAHAAGPSCASAADQLAGTWDATRREHVRAALAAAPRPYAKATADRVVAALDDYARRWTAQRDEACRATYADGRQSAAVLDLRYACLDRRRAELGAIATALSATVDGDVLDRSVDATQQLSSLDACADAAAMRDQTPPPADPVMRARAAELTSRIKTSRALMQLGRYQEATAIAKAAVADARKLGYPLVLADALEALGVAGTETNDIAAARASLEEAARVSADAHDDRGAAEIGLSLLGVVGNDQGKIQEALAMRPLIDTLVRRAGDPPAMRGDLLIHEAALELEAGDGIAARTHAAAALVWIDEKVGKDSIHARDALDLTVAIAIRQGRWDDARAALAREEALVVKLYGDDSTAHANVLEKSAQSFSTVGRADDAEPLARRAIEIDTRARGPDHPDVIGERITLANLASDRGDFAGARDQFKALVPGATRSGDLILEGDVLDGLGQAEYALGDREGGLAHEEQALELRGRARGHESIDYAMGEYNVADGEISLHQCDRARPRLEHVLAVLDHLGVESARKSYAWFAMGNCELDAGHGAEAGALAGKVIAACGPDACPPIMVVAAHVQSGQALWVAGDHAAGAAAIHAGLAAMKALPDGAPNVAEIAAWMKLHRVP